MILPADPAPRNRSQADQRVVLQPIAHTQFSERAIDNPRRLTTLRNPIFVGLREIFRSKLVERITEASDCVHTARNAASC